MNNKRNLYCGDTRYAKVWEQMQLLNIQDVSTERQIQNGTIVWRLPIRVHTAPSITKFIEVASFATGYVRNQNSGYSNYQLNKRCENEPEYYPEHKYNSISGMHDKTGKYLKYTTRGCKLIPIEIDRLEYLISYCLKNYYIKHANFVANGDYVAKWTHEYEMNGLQNKLANSVPKWEYDEVTRWKLQDCGHYDRINALECSNETWKNLADEWKERYKKLNDLYEASVDFNKAMNTPVLDDVSVTINGERYKVI